MLCLPLNKQFKQREFVKMNTTFTGLENQITNSEQIGVLSEYFAKFKIGTLLNRSGIVKTKGASPLAIFTAPFNLSFCNKNLYQGIVRNKEIAVDEDAAYNFLNSSTYNWRRFTLHLCFLTHITFSPPVSLNESVWNNWLCNIGFYLKHVAILSFSLIAFNN